MPKWSPRDTSNLSDEAYQAFSLQGVSRTFALTIPQLPAPLQVVIGNAYLLCRITDTIEDESTLGIEQKESLSRDFIKVVKGNNSAEDFAQQFSGLLTENTPAAERDLISNVPRVVRLTHGFSTVQRMALERCVEEMAKGMVHFQQQQSLNGLRDLDELGDYCYYVAGVVGVMLTELFCDYSEEINAHREELLNLSVSFGQGLQMTNILKDIWEDQKRDASWLPQDVFADCDFDMATLAEHRNDPCYMHGLEKLIGIALMHLRNALQYTLLIPSKEAGIRKFCFWALGMALLTLRKLHRHCNDQTGQEVKISRRSVKATIIATDLLGRGNRAPGWLFNLMALGMPEEPHKIATIPCNVISEQSN